MKLRVVLLSALVAAAVVAVGAGARGQAGPDIFTVHPLVSDDPSGTQAAAGDKSLVNAWGLSAGPTTPWWSSNNGTKTSTL
jgi:hypothetical protein